MNMLWNRSCEDMTEFVPRSSVDLVLMDPPYGMTQVSWDKKLNWLKVWKGIAHSLKEFGAVVIFGIKPFIFDLGYCAPEGWYRYDWIWEKSKATGGLNSKIRPMRAHEELLIFSPKPPRYFAQKTEGKPYNKGLVKAQPEDDVYGRFERVVVKDDVGERWPRSVQYFKTAESERTRYPLLSRTQKPQSLLRYLISTYTLPGDTVLDPCFGSCSAGVAAMALDRYFLGCEMDSEAFVSGKEWLEKEIKNGHSAIRRD